MLVPLVDGTSRRHGRDGSCDGSGYRLAPWPVGQWLEHYTGMVVEIEAHGSEVHWMNGVPFDEYRTVVVEAAPHASNWPVGHVEQMWGEYLHRHGWTPHHDQMGALERSLKRASCVAGGAAPSGPHQGATASPEGPAGKRPQSHQTSFQETP